MSRWRETLCGSVMKAAFLEAESKKGLLAGTTDVFSCGGNYVPQSHHLKKSKKEKPSTIFLPTHHYSIMYGSGDEWNRYDKKLDEDFDEMDVTEVAMRYLDTKMCK